MSSVPYSNRTIPPFSEREERDVRRATGHDIDTVRLRLDEPLDPAVLRGLDDYREVQGDVSLLKTTAKLRNLHLQVTPASVRIQNSVAVFVHGNNAEPFDHDAVRPAFEEVADVLGVPVDVFLGARVMRLDVGVNVPLPMPVVEITGRMEPRSPSRLHQDGRASVRVGTSTTELAVYDKRAERGRRGVHLSYGDGPLARIELRYMKKVSRAFGKPVTAGRLAEQAFYEELGDRLVAHVDKAPFRRITRPVTPTTPTELRKALAFQGIEAGGGLPAVLAAIEADAAAGRITSKKASPLRQEARRLAAQGAPDLAADPIPAFLAAVHAAVYTQNA